YPNLTSNKDPKFDAVTNRNQVEISEPASFGQPQVQPHQRLHQHHLYYHHHHQQHHYQQQRQSQQDLQDVHMTDVENDVQLQESEEDEEEDSTDLGESKTFPLPLSR